MELATLIFQTHWLPLLARLVAIAALLVLFRPLLSGMARAALLVIRPRLTREERAARAQYRNARLMARMIAASSGPSDAAELRAIASRG